MSKCGRNARVSFTLTMTLMMLLSPLSGVNGLYIESFSDGQNQVTVTFPGAGSDNTTAILIPADGVVIDTDLRASGNTYNATVDVGEDGHIDWAFKDTGYGRLGHQDMFSDESKEWGLALDLGEKGSNEIILPKGANILDAQLRMHPKGTVNMSWENDRYFTVQDGRNIVELGFKDKAFLVPALTDFDGDGDKDLLVGYQDFNAPSAGILSFYLSHGADHHPKLETNDTFSSITISNTYIHPVIVDIDSDSDYDLMYGLIDGTVKFYKNDGTNEAPSWTENTTLFAGIDIGDYSALGFADLNGNNKIDLIMGNSNGNFFFFNNTGSQINPQFTEIPAFFPGASTTTYATPTFADMDGDGDIDMVSGDGSGNIIMFQNNGSSTQPIIEVNTTFFKGIPAFSYRSSPVIDDVDGDGDLDVVSGYGNARLVIWKNLLGDNMPDPWGLYSDFAMGNTTLFSTASAIELADLDGDGYEDLVEVTDDSRFITHDAKIKDWGIEFVINQSSWGGYQDGVSFHSPTFWDLDNDGDLDALSGDGSGGLVLFRNTGSSMAPSWSKEDPWSPVASIGVGAYATPELGDLTGDGLPDLIVGAQAGTFKYYTNTGTANSPAFTIDGTLLGTIDYGVGSRTVPELVDIDGDGDLDLVVSHFTSSGWSTVPDMYENTGTVQSATFTKSTTLLGNTGYLIESGHTGFMDLDRDGDLDMIMGGDPVKRLYILKDRAYYNLELDIGGNIQQSNTEACAKCQEIDIRSTLVQALMGATGIDDQYGNSMATLPMDIKALRKFNATFGIEVNYTYGAIMDDLIQVLNDYVADHQNDTDQDGMVPVPIAVSSESDGIFRLFGLNITVDEPPELTGSTIGLTVNEDTKEETLIDLYAMFEDDFTADGDLIFDLEVDAGPVVVALTSGRYISVDAETGPDNDNWTGTLNVMVNATDGLGLTTSTGLFDIVISPVNDPPVMHSTPPTSAQVGTEYLYLMNATDVDEGDVLEYGLSMYPNGMVINHSSGAVRWMPTDSDVGPNQVKITVSDGEVILNQTFTITVAPRAIPNNPPVITSDPNEIAYVGMLYQYDVEATDDDGDNLNFLLPPGGRPSGMTVNFTTGLITWMPTSSQIGDHEVLVIVTDGRDDTGQNFTVTVDDIDLPPLFTSTPVTSANVDVEYTYAVTARDPEERTITFELIQGPAGMTIDKGSGVIQWSPVAGDVGFVEVIVEATDGRNHINQTFTIVVSFLQPQVFLSQPKDNVKVSGSITIKGTSRLDVGSISRVQVKIDDKDWKDAKGTTEWSYDLDTTKLSNGKHTITIRAMSEHTESELKTVTIKVENEETFIGGDLMMLVGMLMVIVVIVVVVLVVVALRKKKKGPELKDVSDQEMAADLALMGQRSGISEEPAVAAVAAAGAAPPPSEETAPEEVPTDDEMADDLALLEKEMGTEEE